MNEYQTVNGLFEITNVIERSKFICYIKGVADETEAKDFIAKIKKSNSLATHNCYAFIADEKGLVQKFSDDGEPQGTAGVPMLEVLKQRKMYKTCAVVTRYFGGIKLGVGGLVRAYSNAVIDCLNTCKIAKFKTAVFTSVCCDYDKFSSLKKLDNKQSIKIFNTDYGNEIKVDFAVEKESFDLFLNSLSDIFNGKANYTVVKEDYYNFG